MKWWCIAASLAIPAFLSGEPDVSRAGTTPAASGHPGVETCACPEDGDSPDAVIDRLVREARSCEARGDLEGRNKALAKLEKAGGPDLPQLNWLLGKVYHRGKWIRPEEIAAEINSQELLQEYARQRAMASSDVDGQMALARWCESNGLRAQRDAHLKQVLAIDPENAVARRMLFHINVNGYWISPEQMAVNQEAADRSARQFAGWSKEIGRIAQLLDSPVKKKRDQGLRDLQAIDDPDCVVAIEQLLSGMNEAIGSEACRKIASFSEPGATHALLRIAVWNPWPTCREQALDLLATRDRYDYVPELISMLATPVSSRFELVPGSSGAILHRHVLVQKGPETDFVRQYDSLHTASPFLNPSNLQPGPDPFAALQAIADAGRETLRMERAVEQYNQALDAQNQAVMYVLRRTTGEDFVDPESWWRWWYDENEVYVSDRQLSYRREQTLNPVISPRPPVPRQCECLAAGTPVWTSRGPQAIETVTTGDLVLCRDELTGQLDFRSVVRPTVRPTSPTYRLVLESETLIASGGHPFHVPGEGWVRVRDLRPGQFLSTLEGMTEVRSVEPSGEQELYNLVVDGVPTYFAGQSRILSHDNSIPSRSARVTVRQAKEE